MKGSERTERSEALVIKLWKIRNKTNMRIMETMFKERGCSYHYETIRDWFDDGRELSPCAIIKLQILITIICISLGIFFLSFNPNMLRILVATVLAVILALCISLACIVGLILTPFVLLVELKGWLDKVNVKLIERIKGDRHGI
jgi:hypothetical protein